MPQPLLQADGTTPAIFAGVASAPPPITISYANGVIVCNSPSGYVITRQQTNDPAEPPGRVIFDETNPTTGTPWQPPWGVPFFRFWKHP